MFAIHSSVKTLGEADEEEVVDGDEDTLSWVAKMRNKDEAKKKAEKKVRYRFLICQCVCCV